MKKNLLPFTLLVLVLWGISSCSNETGEKKNQDLYLPDSINTEGMSQAEIECFSNPDFICESGLAFVRLGDYVADVKLSSLSDDDIQDSVQNGNGFEWLVRTLHLEDGKIIVEGEFIDQRYSNDSLLAVSKVNRIRVESQKYRTPEEIHVGTSLSDFLEKFEAASVQVFPLTEFESINIQVGSQKYIYLVKDAGNRMSTAAGNEFSIDDIPAESRISAIVVM
ncbi:MAG: hypothetical protein R3D00_22965 [Bacteroidia bacterium]